MAQLSPRAYVEVDLAAIDHNIKTAIGVAKKQNPLAQVLAVVKANAYGHGIIPVAQQAITSGATWLGVALLEEAIALREAGITAPIISWLTPLGEDFEAAIKLDIDLAIPSIEIAQAIEAAAKKVGKKARVHLEIDTGMIRGGFLYKQGEFGQPWRDILSYLPTSELNVVGAWTHFASADEPEKETTAHQVVAFKKALSELRATGISPEFIHLSNSAGTFGHSIPEANIYRLGISMYGLSPDVSNASISAATSHIKPALSLYSQVHLVKKIKAGSHIGYGGVGVAQEDTFIAVLPIGYSDGLSRKNDMSVGAWVEGRVAPLIGRISMDQCVINLGPTTSVKAGEYLPLICSEGCNVDAWAKASGTINYEVVTALAPRLKRRYIH